MGGSHSEWSLARVRTYCRKSEYGGRQIVAHSRQSQLAATHASVPLHRFTVGAAHDRTIRKLPECPTKSVQQSLLGTNVGGCRRPCPGQLGLRKQLCKSIVLSSVARAGHSQDTKCRSDGNRVDMESTTMVFINSGNVNSPTAANSKQSERMSRNGGHSGALPEQEMGIVCLKDIWRKKSIGSLGWSETAVERLEYCLAPSTLQTYNRVISKFASFCDHVGSAFFA